MVGTMGFEPMASCSQSKRATKLRNVPKYKSPEDRAMQAMVRSKRFELLTL